jgi:hypothetical protein
VCRSLQLVQQQFQLLPRRGAPVCRHGQNACLEYLRLAYREHRLMAGLIRLGTDLLHQSPLHGMAGVQLVPPRFRSAEHWAELVSHGLLDGAIVSSFCLEKQTLPGKAPKWDGLTAMPLGQLDLQLVAMTPTTKRVLLPRRSQRPARNLLSGSSGPATVSWRSRSALTCSGLAGSRPMVWRRWQRSHH